jgi:hypothetical protein
MTPNEELQQKIEVEVLQALKTLIPDGVHPHVQVISSPDLGDNHESAAPSLKAGDSIVISLQPNSDQSPVEVSTDQPRSRLRRWDFDPITIKGEPLSVTVIRDRR